MLARPLLAVLAAAALLVPAVVASAGGEEEVLITVVVDGDRFVAELAPAEASALSVGGSPSTGHVSLRFSLPEDEKLHAVRVAFVPEAFEPVEHATQMVVEANDRFGVELTAEELAGIEDGLGPFYNLSRDGDGGWTVALLVRSEGETTINVTRDVTPPALVGEPALETLTHAGLMLKTTTSEFAIVSLELLSGTHHQEHRTPTPSIYQTFPIQGLKADREYRYWVNLTDVGLNEASAFEGTFRTLPEPVVPVPVILGVQPAEGVTLPTAPAEVVVTYAFPQAPMVKDRVRLFIDKREVDPAKFVVGETQLRYVPATPFGPGVHSVSVEVENDAGGKAVERWTFTVGTAPTVASEQKGAPAVPLPAVVTGLAVVALLRRRA